MVSAFVSTILLLPFVAISGPDDAKAYGGAAAAKGYADKYAGAYQNFKSQGTQGTGHTGEVTACSTKKCVEEWYKAKVAQTKKFVPKDYQHFSLAKMENEYKKNLARIAAKNNGANDDKLTAPKTQQEPTKTHAPLTTPTTAQQQTFHAVMLTEVTACSTKKCVEEWYKKNEAQTKKLVPEDYQHFVLATIENEYKKNLARIAAKNNGTKDDKPTAPKTPQQEPTKTHTPPTTPTTAQQQTLLAVMLTEVTACSTKKCVEEWYKKNEAQTKKFVPNHYQHFALKTIENEYKKNLARIAKKNDSTHGTNAGEPSLNLPTVAPDELAMVPDGLAAKLAIVPPMLLAQVSACTTKQCVEDWRDRAEAEMETFVPKDYQHIALASIQKEYKKNLARVAQANASNSTKSTGAFLAATTSNPQPFSALLFVGIALFALVPGLFVIRQRAQQRRVGLEEDILRYGPMEDA